MKNVSIKNSSDLREDLIVNVYEKLREHKIGLKEAKERVNTAGKIIATAKLELEYNNFLGNKKVIPFLEVPDVV